MVKVKIDDLFSPHVVGAWWQSYDALLLRETVKVTINPSFDWIHARRPQLTEELAI